MNTIELRTQCQGLWLLSTLTLLVITLCLSCSTPQDDARREEQLLRKLTDGQAKAAITIGGQPFYPEQSVFKGELLLSDGTMFQLNLKDQFGGQVVLNLAEGTGLAKKPFRLVIRENVPTSNRVMIGRLSDPEKQTGEGYLMTKGEATVTTLSKEKLVVRLTGQVGKYLDTDPSHYRNLEGLIVIRRPVIRASGLTEEAYLYQ